MNTWFFLVTGMVLLDSRCVFFSVISGLGVFSDITSPHIQFVGTLRDGRGGGRFTFGTGAAVFRSVVLALVVRGNDCYAHSLEIDHSK